MYPVSGMAVLLTLIIVCELCLIVVATFCSRQPLQQQANKLLICNIPNHVPWDDVKQFISRFGNNLIVEQGLQCSVQVRIIFKRVLLCSSLAAAVKEDSGFSVVVDFESEEQAKQAYNELNGLDYEGTNLKVEIQMEPQPGTSRGGPGGRGRGAYRPPFAPAAPRPTDFPLRILVLSDMVGAIIGRSGGTIKQITQETRARVDVHRKDSAGSLEKVITIYGNPENCSKACRRIMEVMQQEAANTNRPEIPLKILAHNNLIGRIIGKSGNTIKRIMEQTNTKITVSTNVHDVSSFTLERVICIKGKLEDICKAEQMISSKLRQSYESDLAAIAPQTLMFPGLHPLTMLSTLGSTYMGPGAPSPAYGMYGAPPSYMAPVMPYTAGATAPPVSGALPGAAPSLAPLQADQTKETVYLYIPNSAVGAIIGTGGSTIREMISSSGASIKVAQPPKEELEGAQAPPERERKVTIVGTPEAQWKAQFMIFRKVGYEGLAGPQEATLKVEIFVPSSQVGRIIGKGGATVRELQRLTHAVIKLPEEGQPTTAEETPVHIIGDFLSTQAAQRQIRALVIRGTQPPPTRGSRQKIHSNHERRESSDDPSHEHDTEGESEEVSPHSTSTLPTASQPQQATHEQTPTPQQHEEPAQSQSFEK
ncbi:insulin-like growth factor 2 mRNA-binding protein 1 isoform X1, partial [Dinothrombium tinctorium]